MTTNNLTTLSSKGPSQLPRGAVALMATLALLAILTVVDWAQRRQVAELSARMESFYLKPSLAARQALARHYQILGNLAFTQTDDTRQNLAAFHAFADTALASYPEVLAFAWIPRVDDPAADLRPAKTFVADGLIIQAPLSSWQSVLFQQMDARTSFPVYYFRGRDDDLDLWGLDLTTVPGFPTAMRKACDLAKPITIRPHELAGLSDRPDTYLVFRPVYRGGTGATVESRRDNLKGFCAEIFQFSPITAPRVELAAGY